MPISHFPFPTPIFALIAGEHSGDQLGADLIVALRQRYPQAQFVGIGGARMQAQGFESWYAMEQLSLFGLAEVVTHLPGLLRLRRALVARLIATRPAVVIGIDAPDFNLGVERRLKQAGVRTVHYVSPSVWGWREQRAAKISQSADRVLCLFPMEPAIYERHDADARFVGHPLADRFALVSDRYGAREALSLAQDVPVLAVLPGSRASEIKRLGRIFIDAARRIVGVMPNLQVVIPAASANVHQQLTSLLAAWPHDLPAPLLLDGHAHQAIVAADVVLLASGTATLEAMLAKRPMVVGYRVSPISYRIARVMKMLKTDVYSLPNVLGRACGLGETPLVPELMQEACTAANLADATVALLADSEQRARTVAAFETLHHALRGGLAGSAAEHAAEAVAELLETHD